MIRVQLDSRPERIDQLERQLLQLEVEATALKQVRVCVCVCAFVLV